MTPAIPLDASAIEQRKDFLLQYDESVWKERVSRPKNTLQIFVTDKCNLRCPECFYGQWLGTSEMPLEEYEKHVLDYKNLIQKVILLGGEPTLHKKLPQMVEFNAGLGLETTVYTNGANLKILNGIMSDPAMKNMVAIRIGVHGLTVSEKPLLKVPETNLPVSIVYTLAAYNHHELIDTASLAERNFDCHAFYISSIREIEKTGSFWLDTENTLPMPIYAQAIQDFVANYKGNIPELHLSTRGVLVTKKQDFTSVTRCRFGSILRDGSKITAPLDISLNRTAPQLAFDEQKCSRHHKCVLQKIVLQRI